MGAEHSKLTLLSLSHYKVCINTCSFRLLSVNYFWFLVGLCFKLSLTGGI